MSELAVRTLAGAVMILIALLTAWQGGTLFALFVASVATLIYFEWSRLVRGWGLDWHIGGFVYALLPALGMLWVRERAFAGFELIVWIFLVTWAADIGGYFVGRAVGGPKLAPTISPNKTIAGLVGAIGAATLAAGGWALAAGLSPLWMLLAPLFAFAAAMGDLFESWIKRRAGVKDSGAILPGHGGLLDRLDGMVPVAVLSASVVLAGLS